MWIARLSNGNSVSEKKFREQGLSYSDLDLTKVTSLQLLFKGNVLTVSRANDTQFLLQEKVADKNMMLKQEILTNADGTISFKITTGDMWEVALAEQLIYCIYNSNGDAIGWWVNHQNGDFRQIKFNAKKKGFHESIKVEFEKIVLQIPDVKGHVMK